MGKKKGRQKHKRHLKKLAKDNKNFIQIKAKFFAETDRAKHEFTVINDALLAWKYYTLHNNSFSALPNYKGNLPKPPSPSGSLSNIEENLYSIMSSAGHAGLDAVTLFGDMRSAVQRYDDEDAYEIWTVPRGVDIPDMTVPQIMQNKAFIHHASNSIILFNALLKMQPKMGALMPSHHPRPHVRNHIHRYLFLMDILQQHWDV